MRTTLAARRLVTATAIVEYPEITLEGPIIASISSRERHDISSVTYNFPESTITAGLLDIHMHGAVGHDVMEGETDALRRIGTFLAHHGVTEYLATTVTASLDFTLCALDRIAGHIARQPASGEAAIRGIHIEGPFLSHLKRGMHPSEFLLSPTPAVLDKLWEAASGRIKLMTIAPEIPGALETIARANELGIRCSIGHSDANATEALDALGAGAVSATHTFNAMRPLDHREPGILGIVLDRDDMYADLICDGVHVAPELVRLWFKAKGPERAILITDSLEATGMPDGRYKLGQTIVNVKDRHCTTERGVLAGSVLTLDEAVRKLQEFTGTDLATAVRLASTNPARMLGLPHELRVGVDANLNIYGPAGDLKATVLRGQLI
jgi:N-acetylglucosamine-6-phosphate deacetylase